LTLIYFANTNLWRIYLVAFLLTYVTASVQCN